MSTFLGLGLGALIFAVLIWLLPILLILRSQKTNGAEKLFWLLAVLFVSWFAWIFYVLLAPIGDKRSAT
jgi:uncharacterized protein with PQ loop repeat